MSNINEEIKDFYSSVCFFGYLDVESAVKTFLDAGKDGDDLAKEVLKFAEDNEADLKDVDVCGVAYETLLQEARNKISEVLNFDFINDRNFNIYTSSNYIGTSYDDTETLQEELTTRLEEATEEERSEILDDEATNWFLKEIEVLPLKEEKERVLISA
jgi:ABC-type oligopeptide transport system substrate-binding subunit